MKKFTKVLMTAMAIAQLGAVSALAADGVGRETTSTGKSSVNCPSLPDNADKRLPSDTGSEAAPTGKPKADKAN